MIGIVGLGPSHDEAPGNIELWGLPWDHRAYEYERLFEMHDRSLFAQEEAGRGGDYLKRLQSFEVPIYMQKTFADIPNSVAYPLDAVSHLVGDYFGSSPAYMLAMAILEGVPEIGLWGVDLKDDYDHQRPNLEYLIGFARGYGLKVEVFGDGKLLTHRPEDRLGQILTTYPTRYGWL